MQGVCGCHLANDCQRLRGEVRAIEKEEAN